MAHPFIYNVGSDGNLSSYLNFSTKTYYVDFSLTLYNALCKFPFLYPKNGMDPNFLSNFRPVSNLASLAKIPEKAVNSRLDGYLSANKLYDPLQSAYRKQCSTETALVKDKNDIMVHLDQGNRVALLLLDMSAAFDTLDHTTLLNRFNKEFGIRVKPLKWFESYFSEITQSVVIRSLCH